MTILAQILLILLAIAGSLLVIHTMVGSVQFLISDTHPMDSLLFDPELYYDDEFEEEFGMTKDDFYRSFDKAIREVYDQEQM